MDIMMLYKDALVEYVRESVPVVVECLQTNREHVIYAVLIFLFLGVCVDASNANFPWSFASSRFLKGNLSSEKDRKDLRTLRKWTAEHPDLSKTTSSHWWYASLPKKEKDAFARVANSGTVKAMFQKRFPGYDVVRVDGMDEIYATGPPVKGTSDEVFYTKHIDGPFMFFRFASVYRCLIGLDDNTQTVTKFPMIPDQIAAQTGDVFGFDFNREIHYIEQDPARAKNKKQRIVLKVHYAVFPSVLRPWGLILKHLNVLYNVCFRKLFLKTIRPSTWFEDVLARFGVVGVTKIVYKIEQYVGYNNIMYYALAVVIAIAYDNYAVFLGLTSFVHYVRYITTYYTRDNIAYGDFKRDVLLFKSIALLQLAIIYLRPFDFDPARAIREDTLSVAMIACGYAISMLATRALGVDRTYFGVELGFLEPKWIDAFPYGTIPHPMIASQVFALGGFLASESMRATCASGGFEWLLPTHIGLYLVHMLQEMYDVHGSTKHGKTPRSTSNGASSSSYEFGTYDYEVATCDADYVGIWDGEWERCLLLRDDGETLHVRCFDDAKEVDVPKRFVREISGEKRRVSSRRRTRSRSRGPSKRRSTPRK